MSQEKKKLIIYWDVTYDSTLSLKNCSIKISRFVCSLLPPAHRTILSIHTCNLLVPLRDSNNDVYEAIETVCTGRSSPNVIYNFVVNKITTFEVSI